MPDLMSHLIIGLILAELFNVKKKSLVALGALMPDLLSKAHLIFFYLGLPLGISFTSFHTPFMAFLISILISPLFLHDKLKTMIFFNIGSMSHFISDLTIRHFSNVGVRLHFPLTLEENHYSLDWIWPEQSIYVLIATLLLYITIKVVKKNKKKD